MYSVTHAIIGKLLWKIKLEAIQQMFCNFTQNIEKFEFVNLVIAATKSFYHDRHQLNLIEDVIASIVMWQLEIKTIFYASTSSMIFTWTRSTPIDILTKCKYLSGKAIESTNVCANDYGKKM